MSEKNKKPEPTDPIPLDFPFTTVTGKRVESITLRRAKVRDRRIVSKQYEHPADVEVALIALLAGLTFEDIDELMDAADFGAVQSRFFELISGKPVPVPPIEVDTSEMVQVSTE